MILILTILTLIVVDDALGDAWRFKEKQDAHHNAEWFGRVLYFGFAYLVAHLSLSVIDVIWCGVYVASFYIAFFDLLFNKFAGLPYDYVGNSNWWDRLPIKVKNPLRFVSYGTLVFSLIMIIK